MCAGLNPYPQPDTPREPKLLSNYSGALNPDSGALTPDLGALNPDPPPSPLRSPRTGGATTTRSPTGQSRPRAPGTPSCARSKGGVKEAPTADRGAPRCARSQTEGGRRRLPDRGTPSRVHDPKGGGGNDSDRGALSSWASCFLEHGAPTRLLTPPRPPRPPPEVGARQGGVEMHIQ